MRRELLIAAGPGEWRAVLLEDGAPADLLVERGDQAPAGSIHLGRVVQTVPALGAALVEIGDARPGFLPVRDVMPAGAAPTEGARAVVRVRREAQGGKAALLSMRLAAADDTASAALHDRAARLEPPARLFPAAGFAAALALRLNALPEQVGADDPAILAELRAAFPPAAVEHRPAADWPVDIEAVFDAALAPDCALAGGASMHIETTRAGTMVDIDSGTPERGTPASVALAVNLAGAVAIARQLRLREIGGGVIIDFVGIEGRAARDRVRAALAAALAADPALPQLLGWTRLGHFELVRPRRRRTLAELLLDADAPARTAATVAFAALRAVKAAARHRPAANWRLLAAPEVAEALAHEAAGGLRALEAWLGRHIAVTSEPGRARARFEIVAA